MNANELKHKLREIFGEQIVFNKEFDKRASTLKNQEKNLLKWCEKVKEKKIPPISSSIINDSVIFIKRIGSSNRCIIIKIKNNYISEIHLGNHLYYDKLRKALGIKKDNKFYFF